MAATTIPPRTHATPPWQRVRNALTTTITQGAQMASAARHRNWSPALTISGLASIDGGIWQHFGAGTGWIAIGVSALLYDFSREKS